jgi:hypothetical protein
MLEPTKAEEALPSTFEDALVFENVQFFSGLDGTGLVKKFSDALKNKNTAIDIGGVPGLKCASGEERHWTRRAYGTRQKVPA